MQLTSSNINWKLITNTNSLYDRNKSYVWKNNMQSGILEINNGLRQDGVMSPKLFMLAMADAKQTLESRTSALHFGYDQLKLVELST